MRLHSVGLTSTLNLTDGYVQKFWVFDDHIAFCVH